MENLRDLTVGITFEDNATRDLIRIDEKTDDIRDNFRGMSADLVGLSAEFGQAGISGSHAMNDVKDATEETTQSLVTMGIAGEVALNRIKNEADDAGNEIEDIKNKVKRATRQIVGMGMVTSLISVGFSGAVAASAPLLVGIGGLAASFGAAGIGAAAFGAVAVGALKDVFDKQKQIAKLQEKIAKADTAKERIKAQKELAALYAGIGQEQRNMLQELQSFKTFWSGFVQQFEAPVFQTFANGLKGLKGVLTGLQPTIKNVADVFVELSNEFNQSLNNPSIKRFFDWLETNASESLYNFAHIFGNTFMGVANMLQAFSPVGASVEEWLVKITQRFEEWSAGLNQSTGFQNFVNYARENGPVLAQTLSNIWDIGVKLVKAFAPLGSEALQGFQSLTSYISTNVMPTIDSVAGKAAGFASTIRDNWGPIKETVIGLAVAVGTFKAAMTGLQIIGAINTLLKAFREGTVAATLAEWGFNAALWANPATWVVAGIAALVAIGVVLYRNWDTIKAKAGELWAWLKVKWAGIKASTSEAWQSVKSSIGNAMETAKSKVSSFFSPLLGWISSAKEKWNSFVSAIKMPKIGLPKWMGGNGLIQIPGHATGLSKVPYDNYLMRAHKDETVLRADQARALEQAGILDRSGHTPKINSLGVSPSVSTRSTSSGAQPVFSPTVNITVYAADVKSAGSLEAAVNRKLEEMWQMFLDIYPVEVVR